jgi:hypothetical protein
VLRHLHQLRFGPAPVLEHLRRRLDEVSRHTRPMESPIYHTHTHISSSLLNPREISLSYIWSCCTIGERRVPRVVFDSE